MDFISADTFLAILKELEGKTIQSIEPLDHWEDPITEDLHHLHAKVEDSLFLEILCSDNTTYRVKACKGFDDVWIEVEKVENG
jgi:hypothetical protein